MQASSHGNKLVVKEHIYLKQYRQQIIEDIRTLVVHPEAKKRKIAHCSKCGKEGHYSSTCDVP